MLLGQTPCACRRSGISRRRTESRAELAGAHPDRRSAWLRRCAVAVIRGRAPGPPFARAPTPAPRRSAGEK
jgi:hypothetical protein